MKKEIKIILVIALVIILWLNRHRISDFFTSRLCRASADPVVQFEADGVKSDITNLKVDPALITEAHKQVDLIICNSHLLDEVDQYAATNGTSFRIALLNKALGRAETRLNERNRMPL